MKTRMHDCTEWWHILCLFSVPEKKSQYCSFKLIYFYVNLSFSWLLKSFYWNGENHPFTILAPFFRHSTTTATTTAQQQQQQQQYCHIFGLLPFSVQIANAPNLLTSDWKCRPTNKSCKFTSHQILPTTFFILEPILWSKFDLKKYLMSLKFLDNAITILMK